jgi:hypothetical protein
MGLVCSRRQFLALTVLSVLSPHAAGGETKMRAVRAYEADIGVLFNLLTFSLSGTIVQEVDRAGGRYRVTVNGKGFGITAGTESVGVIRDGRFMPTETRGFHVVRGRENRVALNYDYEHGFVEYHSLTYTLLLGRRRQADDVVRLAPGQRVDDLISAELNFAADRLDREPDGAYRLTVVRRARPEDEGPDDVSPSGYHAELATVRFHASSDASTGRLTAAMDLTGFSSWARRTQPAKVVFAPDRHLASVTSSLILGTTFSLRLTPVS